MLTNGCANCTASLMRRHLKSLGTEWFADTTLCVPVLFGRRSMNLCNWCGAQSSCRGRESILVLLFNCVALDLPFCFVLFSFLYFTLLFFSFLFFSFLFEFLLKFLFVFLSFIIACFPKSTAFFCAGTLICTNSRLRCASALLTRTCAPTVRVALRLIRRR